MRPARARAAIAVLLSVNAVLVLACVAPAPARAGGSNQVQGFQASGSPVVGDPVLTAGSDGTNVRTLSVDATGRIKTVGSAASGSSASGAPTTVAGVDSSSTVRQLFTDPSGRAWITQGWTPQKAVPFAPVASNGTTWVQWGPSSSAGLSVVIGKLAAVNNSATAHTWSLRSSGSQVFFDSLPLAANGGAFFLDDDVGSVRSFAGEVLQFSIDNAGSAPDVKVSGTGTQE